MQSWERQRYLGFKFLTFLARPDSNYVACWENQLRYSVWDDPQSDNESESGKSLSMDSAGHQVTGYPLGPVYVMYRLYPSAPDMYTAKRRVMYVECRKYDSNIGNAEVQLQRYIQALRQAREL
jgi:hypothetical protein